MLVLELLQINESMQFTPQEQQRAATYLQPFVDSNGEIDLERFFDKEMQLSAGGFTIPPDAFSVKTVDIFQLYPTQDVVELKWVQAVLANQGRTQGLPEVAITDQMTIIDGHHRVVANIAAGRKAMAVRLTRATFDDQHEMSFVPG